MPAGASRLDTLVSANQAYLSGDAQRAAELYLRVATTPPSAGESPPLTGALAGLARFRAILALVAAGQDDQAASVFHEAQSELPRDPWTALAAEFWDQYSMTARLPSACAHLQGQSAAALSAALAPLAGTPAALDPAALCSAPGPRR